MEGARHLLRSGAFTSPRHHHRHQHHRRHHHHQFFLLVLVLVVVLAGCGKGSSAEDTVATPPHIRNGNSSPPRASPKAQRAILTFDGTETAEGRLEFLREVRDDGYACWLFPWIFSAAVCLQNDDTITAAIIPESARSLRSILWRVNLETWLPSVLCSARDDSIPSPTSGIHSQDEHDCIELVEDALRGSETANSVVATVTVGGVQFIASAATNETPWVQAMARCMEPDFARLVLPFECRNLYQILASERERVQLLPALEVLSRNAAATASAAASSALAPGKKHSLPFPENIERLLHLIRPGSGQTPSLRMIAPRPSGRTSGTVFAFMAQYTLGTALRARLAEGLTRSTDKEGEAEQSSLAAATISAEAPPVEAQSDEKGSGKETPGGTWRSAAAPRSGDDQLSAEAGGEDGSRHHGRDGGAAWLPPLARCEIRGVVDGVEAVRIPLDATETKESLIARAVYPAYPPRCSEHPLQAELEEKAGGSAGGAWGASEDVVHLEAREVERVCTPQSFGVHRAHAELSCCTVGVAGDSANHETSPAAAAGDATPPGSRCEVFAKTSPVDYFHTANGADVYSSWEEEDGDSGGEGRSRLLLDPPPDDISVSLYLESAPKTIRTTVTVPRWSSDGEVWEAAFRACSETFGPEQAVMANNNDCVHLATSAIQAKRADLFYRMSLRLDAYLRGKDPSFVFEGHTGYDPEKVEVLGAMSRGGGERVGMVCEVGFNAGHSSLNWLLSSPPSTRVLAFDLGAHGYVEHALAFLQAVFPGRLLLVAGDSAVTVPAYVAEARQDGRDPRACDVVFVDGDHREEAVYADLVNFQAIASRGWHVLVMDDMHMSSVSAAWRRFREEGRGRLEHVVQSTSESRARLEEDEEEGATKGDKWNQQVDNQPYRLFAQHGFISLGIGYLRPPPPQDNIQDA